MSKRAILFVNGILDEPRTLRPLVAPGDFLVAVDGGARVLHAMGLEPHLLVGDLDSLPEQDVAALEATGCEVRRFAVEKDETDLELALQIVAARGFESVRILAALGGRLDQMLGNLFLLANPAWEELDVRVLDVGLEAFAIHHQAHIEGHPGDLISLLPLNGPAHGVQTEDLVFPLRGETLWPEHTRGISNRMLSSGAWVRLEQGVLLCIHTSRDFDVNLH